MIFSEAPNDFLNLKYGNNNYLMHHGVKGMKWGIRRYQNEDGSLTAEGRERYKQLMNKSFGLTKLGKHSNVKDKLYWELIDEYSQKMPNATFSDAKKISDDIYKMIKVMKEDYDRNN